MSFRIASQHFLRRSIALRHTATPASARLFRTSTLWADKSSEPGRKPKALEGLFGGPDLQPPNPPGTPRGDVHPGSESHRGHAPSESGLPGETTSRPERERQTEQQEEENDQDSLKQRRKKLSDSQKANEKAGSRVGISFGGGGGGGGSGGSGGGGGGGGLGGLTPNQLVMIIVSTYFLYSLTAGPAGVTREITWQDL